MKLAVCDADLISAPRHRFPNLAILKMAAFYGAVLITDYSAISDFDKVYISKVFTTTPIPESVITAPNVVVGGTGFFFDKAEPLPPDIEHIKPDYNLYHDWAMDKISASKAVKRSPRVSYESFLDYSIGFTTRGCTRKCSFCVNRNVSSVTRHSPVAEFLDPSKKVICLLDDNILAYPGWSEVLEELRNTGKQITFKQGLDLRLMTDGKAQALSGLRYKGDYIFAFDNIADRQLIERKLTLWREHVPKKSTKLYVLCGFDRSGAYDAPFWRQDSIDTFERIKILMRFNCLPYIMRYGEWKDGPNAGLYKVIAAWCNNPACFKKMSLRQYGECRNGSDIKHLQEFEQRHPDIAAEYYDMRWSD